MVTYTNPGSIEFDGVITRSDVRGASSYVAFPFDTKKLFGVAGRVPVTVAIDGEQYRGSLVSHGGPHLVLVLKEIQERLGKGPGDSVHLRVELDTSERVVELDPEIEASFESGGVLATFRGLSYSRQRELALWITGAKRAETRSSRIEKAIGMVRSGERLP